MEAETMRKYAETHGFEIGNEQYVCPRPLPGIRDEHGEIRKQTVKRLFAKIDEELNELKQAIFVLYSLDADAMQYSKVPECAAEEIPREAADTITAITTMLEALGINAEMRDEAQRWVNEKNRKRGRLQ